MACRSSRPSEFILVGSDDASQIPRVTERMVRIITFHLKSRRRLREEVAHAAKQQLESKLHLLPAEQRICADACRILPLAQHSWSATYLRGDAQG